MPTCLQWGEERVESCTSWADQGHSECTQWRDDGYSSCTAYEADCCDWWPCSWACKLVSWICVASVWVSSWVCIAAVWIAKWVCVGWTVVTTAICVLWDVVTTIVNAVLVTLEGLIGWVLSLIAAVVEIILSIPIIGAILRWVISLVTAVINIVASIVDILAGLVGIRPEKILRVCPVILADEFSRPVGNLAHAVDQLQVAADMLKRDCNIRLVPSGPFQYSTGFNGAPQVTEGWIKVLSREVGDPDTLDPSCNAEGFGNDLGKAGSKFNLLMTTHCFFGNWRRLTGYGAPVAVFFVRSVGGAEGCGLWITDFVTVVGRTMPVQPDLRRITTHEIGHATNLWHVPVASNGDNLMSVPRPMLPDVMQFRFYDWQVLLVRASKHVSYF
ncbi:hypothetical protein [Rhizobium sp. SL86]|uniref:hypothetical protein n=1 Tax=Rhizobium sp. SL86 TaxID=2995148 RepID=UPI002275F832|nr:hypothetical protein [Rhizobium sp. SL86]MCY1668923.1 hypothetical protein [Rhizobium sp. SL86]